MMKIKKNIAIGFIVILTMVASFAFATDKARSGNLLANAGRTVAYRDNNAAPIFQKVVNFDKSGKNVVTFRTIFQVENPEKFVALELEKPNHIKDFTLNGKPIPKPLKGMTYKTIPGIPASLLKKGSNELRAILTVDVKAQKEKKTSKTSFVPKQINSEDINIQLFGLTPSALTFQTGPILGYAGEKMFTVTCRVNIPAEVVLEVNGKEYISKPALLHSFKVEGLKADTQYQYSLKTRLSSKDDFQTSIGPFSVRTLKSGDKFSFVIVGDSRSYPENWAEVAAAITAEKPAFTVFVGDMVTYGLNDYEWDEQHFSPAKEFFSSIPYYGVIGNHERDCPLFTNIFQTPGGGKNWSQEIGSTLLIGIDGTMDWEIDGVQTKWLENILANSKAKFIFLASHYPPWTSGGHGRLKDGRPRERTIKLGQDVLMPLLKKYNATAMFAGHDHFYERSEPDGGVTMIIAGGGGVGTSHKVKDPEKQNPYSKVFESKHHYTLITIDGDVCTMKAITPEGVVIDTRTWESRKGSFWNRLLNFFSFGF